jgi:signal transduction histidine kinase
LLECIEGALELVSTLAANKGLELAYTIDRDVPEAMVGDTTRLRQILINLFSNAIKFTPAGEVVLSVTATRKADKFHEVRFAVRDSGIGIPADRLESLVFPFTQVDSSVTRRLEVRAGAGHLQEFRGGHGRPHHSHQRSGQRNHLCLHDSGRAQRSTASTL